MSALSPPTVSASMFRPQASWPNVAEHLAVEKLPLCQLCRWELASGVFQAEFSSGDELVLLCAQCGFARAWSTWHGHMTKKLKTLTLVATLLRKGDEAATFEAVPHPVPLHRSEERRVGKEC